MANDAWLEEMHPPAFKLDDWSQLIRGSPTYTRIGNMCSLTSRPGFDPPSFDISTVSSLTSTVALGVCIVSEDSYSELCKALGVINKIAKRIKEKSV